MKFSYYIIISVPTKSLLPNWHIKSLKLFKFDPVGKSEAKFFIFSFKAKLLIFHCIMNEDLSQTISRDSVVSLISNMILWQIRIRFLESILCSWKMHRKIYNHSSHFIFNFVLHELWSFIKFFFNFAFLITYYQLKFLI